MEHCHLTLELGSGNRKRKLAQENKFSFTCTINSDFEIDRKKLFSGNHMCTINKIQQQIFKKVAAAASTLAAADEQPIEKLSKVHSIFTWYSTKYVGLN